MGLSAAFNMRVLFPAALLTAVVHRPAMPAAYRPIFSRMMDFFSQSRELAGRLQLRLLSVACNRKYNQ
jgi:hypothetical protein